MQNSLLVLRRQVKLAVDMGIVLRESRQERGTGDCWKLSSWEEVTLAQLNKSEVSF